MLSRIENVIESNIRLERVGSILEAFLKIMLPNERATEVEVDTGTNELALHTKLMGELGVKKGNGGVKESRGKDETNHSYVRYFTNILGRVSLENDFRIYQQDPDVMFQDIIYDGPWCKGFSAGSQSLMMLRHRDSTSRTRVFRNTE